MKSVIFSGIFIIIIIILLVFFTYYTNSTAEILLNISENFYKTESVSENLKILQSFNAEWNKRKPILSCFISHGAAKIIDETIAELKAYIEINNKAEALARIEKLKVHISALPENDAVNFQNVL